MGYELNEWTINGLSVADFIASAEASGVEVKLDIDLSIYYVNSISINIYSEAIYSGERINYSDILIMTQTTDSRQQKIDASSVRYTINGIELEKDEYGVIIPETICSPVWFCILV